MDYRLPTRQASVFRSGAPATAESTASSTSSFTVRRAQPRIDWLVTLVPRAILWAGRTLVAFAGILSSVATRLSRVITPERGATAVDGLLTGWHEPEASHIQMLEAVAGRPVLDVAYEAASAEGYLWHEFGDVHLILP